MEDLSHPRLHKRGNVYYLRASYPVDIAHLFKAKEKWRSLRTGDHRDAVRKVRAASAAFDAEMERLREIEANAVAPVNLSQREITRLCGKLYLYAMQRWEDQPGSPIIYQKINAAMSKLDSKADLEREVKPFVDELLSRSSVGVVDDDTRERLLGAVRHAIRDAATTLERRANGDYGPDRLIERFGPLEKTAPQGATLKELVADYLADPGAKRNAKTLLSYRIVFDALLELVGEDKAAAAVTRQDCERVRDLLMTLPKNARKHYPNKSLQEAARLAKTDGLPLMAPGTINSYLNNLSALFNWAEESWRVPRNPAKGLQIVDPVKAKNKKHPIPIEDLPKLFAMPLYVGCVDDESGYAKPGPNQPRRGRFWVPLLSLLHGVRQGEASQLHTADVQQVVGVWCLMLSEESPDDMEQEDRKRIKTAAGQRFVPLHSEMVRMGFLDFVREKRDSGSKRLFPELQRDTYGYFSVVSKWFSRFLDKADIKKPRITFHSLRHNYRDALRRAQLPRDVVVALGGWAGEGVEDDYGGDPEAFVPTLAAAVAKVSYPGLDLSHLYLSASSSERSEMQHQEQRRHASG